MMNDSYYGHMINTHYDWVNMLNTMKQNKPQRFEEFQYSQETIYHYLDKLQQEQNLVD
jgi:hypothetical protein